jgi:transcriptional regulator with XRE-family HTH domain
MCSGLDIQTLSNKSKVPKSVISKIENSNSSITIPTFVALCYGLNKTPLQFFEETNLLPSIRFTQFDKFDLLPKHDDENLYLADVEGFLRGISLSELSVEEIFINLLIPAICSREDCSKEVARLQAENLIRDAIQMDFGESISLSYPKDIRIEDLLVSFDNESIMIFQDAGAYLRSMRNMKNLNLLQLQEIVGVSKSSLGRLELGMVERAKVAELIELDRALSTEGLLTAIYCRVALFHSGIARNYFYHISDLPPLGFE